MSFLFTVVVCSMDVHPVDGGRASRRRGERILEGKRPVEACCMVILLSFGSYHTRPPMPLEQGAV